MKNVVDSSAWLEYFADGPNADSFSAVVQDLENLIVPTICIYEVFKTVLRQRGEDAALHTYCCPYETGRGGGFHLPISA